MAKRPDLGSLALFVRIAETHSITKAARASHIALVEAVRKGSADVGIVMEGADAQGLQLFEYRTDLLCAVVPRRHPVRGRKVAFAKLLDHDFVGLESNTVISRLMLEEAARAGKP